MRLGIFLLATACMIALTPTGAAIKQFVPQDDGGSGADAPDTPVDAIRIERGSSLRGTLVNDYADFFDLDKEIKDLDHYAFVAQAGDVVTATVLGFETCVRVVDGSGTPVGGGKWWGNPAICALNVGTTFGSDTATIPADGTYFLAIQVARGADSTPYKVWLD